MKYYERDLNSILHPFTDQHDYPGSTILGGWSNHVIGRSYIELYDHRERAILSRPYKTTSQNKRHKTMLKEVHDFMGKGICTANFYTPLHIDPRDGNNITNCTYSLPPSWNKQSTTQTVFSLGNYVIDISKHNCNIAFLGNHSVHSTGIPVNSEKCFKNLPDILSKEYTSERAVKEKNLIQKYLSMAIIGWGHFGRSSRYHNSK